MQQLLAYIYSSPDFGAGNSIRLLWNHPPQPITEDQMTYSLEKVFGGSTQELITVDNDS